MFLVVSGDESLDAGGEGDAPLVNKLAPSATDDGRDVSRVLVLRTAKKVVAGRSLVVAASTTGVLPESFSSALMRCEMLEPSLLALLGLTSDACC
jgi:hypothetical protein